MPTQLTEGSKALQPSDGNTSHKPPSRKTYTKQTASDSFREMVALGHSYRTNVTNPRMFHSQMTWASGVKSSEAGRILKGKRNVQNKKTSCRMVRLNYLLLVLAELHTIFVHFSDMVF